jgi:hypothetical protein
MSTCWTRTLTVVAVPVLSTLIISMVLPATGGEPLRAAESPVLQRIFANWKSRSERGEKEGHSRMALTEAGSGYRRKSYG